MLFRDQYNADLIRQQLLNYVSSEYSCTGNIIGHIISRPVTNYSKLMRFHSNAFKPTPKHRMPTALTNDSKPANDKHKLHKLSISNRKQKRWNAQYSISNAQPSTEPKSNSTQAFALSKLHAIASSIRKPLEQVKEEANKNSFEITIFPCEMDMANCENLSSTISSIHSYKEKNLRSSQDLIYLSPLPKITYVECYSNRSKTKRAKSIASCN